MSIKTGLPERPPELDLGDFIVASLVLLPDEAPEPPPLPEEPLLDEPLAGDLLFEDEGLVVVVFFVVDELPDKEVDLVGALAFAPDPPPLPDEPTLEVLAERSINAEKPGSFVLTPASSASR